LVDRIVAEGRQCALAERLLTRVDEDVGGGGASSRELLSAALDLALRGDRVDLLARVSKRTAVLEMNSQNGVRALEFLLAAEFLYQQVGDTQALLENRYDLGVLLLWVGRLAEARSVLEPLTSDSAAAAEDPSLLPASLTILGRVYLALGELDLAEAALQRARDLRAEDDRTGLRATLDALSRLRILQGRFREADRLNRQVIDLLGSETRAITNALVTAAEIHLGLGRPHVALAYTRQARRISRRAALVDPNMEIHSLFIDALSERARGNRSRADASMRALLARADSFRREGQGSLTVPFFSIRRQYLSVWVDDLLAEGRVDEAFEVVEWTRARQLLLELLESGEPGSRSERQRRRLLRAELADLKRGELTPWDAEARSDRAQRVRLAWLALEAPRNGARRLWAPPLIGAAEARGRAARQRALILYYWFGEEEGHLWVFSPRGSRAESGLPSRRAVERSALRLRHLLEKGGDADAAARDELEALSQALLGPVAEDLAQAEEVIFVPDGALSQVPLTALRKVTASGKPGPPLASTLAVSQVYSLSVLSALNEDRDRRRREQRTVMSAMGDPVYSPRDPRLSARSARSGTAKGWYRSRLPESAQEVRAIQEMAPGGTRAYLGVAASRRRVLAGALRDSRFIHLGSHAQNDPWDPYLSAIELSAFDEDGHAVDGSLRLQDLTEMQVAADLVFLAGCRTGIGVEYLGEGSLALPRGFFAAGAGAVVVSLWDVEDEPTGILARAFWQGVLGEELAPAEALRRAQWALATSQRWSAPRHWAGWVLLGDGGP